jgi:RNA polymerase sigma-70 factor (ECF subfamily)
VIRTPQDAPTVWRSPQQLIQLVGAVSRHDTAAFKQLYAATSAKPYGIVFRVVGRREVADEVLKDTYLRIWQHAGRFDQTRGSPITWVATIARNRALEEANRAACPNISDDLELLEVPLESNALTQYERAENTRTLYACLARLGSEKRQIIVQAYCLGMSRQDIAKETGQPVSTIKTWLRRSLAQLKSCLNEGI